MKTISPLLLLAIATSPLGCSTPVGIRYRELYIDRLEVPSTIRRGEPVTIGLVNIDTPAGDPEVSASVDERTRTIHVKALEYAIQRFMPSRSYSQAVVTRTLDASFTPASAGTYTLDVNWGKATASLVVTD